MITDNLEPVWLSTSMVNIETCITILKIQIDTFDKWKPFFLENRLKCKLFEQPTYKYQ